MKSEALAVPPRATAISSSSVRMLRIRNQGACSSRATSNGLMTSPNSASRCRTIMRVPRVLAFSSTSTSVEADDASSSFSSARACSRSTGSLSSVMRTAFSLVAMCNSRCAVVLFGDDVMYCISCWPAPATTIASAAAVVSSPTTSISSAICTRRADSTSA